MSRVQDLAPRKELAWQVCSLAQRQALEYEFHKRAEAYNELDDLYCRHQPTIITTWNATNEHERRTILKEAWPKMTAELTPDLTAPLTREYSLWPCLNLAFLAGNPTVLLTFLYYRTTSLPIAYVFADFLSAHLEKAGTGTHFPWADALSEEHSDRLETEVAINFSPVEPYYALAEQSLLSLPSAVPLTLNIITARKHIEIQSHLYQVLANIAREIMNNSGIPASQWQDAAYPPRKRNQLTTPDSDGSECVLRWHYGSPWFNHARIFDLIDAQVDKVSKYLSDLRFDPAIFDKAMIESDDMALISRPSYPEDSPDRTMRFLAQVQCVPRAIQDVDKWTALQGFCYDMPATPSPTMASLDYAVFYYHLDQMMRFTFEKFSEVFEGTDPTSSAYFELDLDLDEVRGETTQKLLQKTYNNLLLLRSAEIPYNKAAAVLDYLQRALRSPKCRVRSVVRRLLEALIVLVACRNHLCLYMAPHADPLVERWPKETLNEFLHISRSHHQETWPNLRKKETWTMVASVGGIFHHDMDEEQTSKDSSARQKAEHYFDRSWEELIDILYDQEALSDITTKILRRQFCRPHWEVSEPEQTAEDDLESEECPKLVNTAFKCLWDETRAAQEERQRLELAAMRLHNEESQAQPPEPATTTETAAEEGPSSDRPTPSGNPVILVSEDTFHVLRMLFHDPENLSTGGELDWNELLKAMEDIGFIHDGSRSGSRHSFKPDPSRLAVTSSISFHDEHRAKVSRRKARYFGKDMNRLYDWNLETFAIRPRLRV
jgi:hypothetical protein